MDLKLYLPGIFLGLSFHFLVIVNISTGKHKTNTIFNLSVSLKWAWKN